MPVVKMAVPVKARVRTIVIAVFSIPPLGVIQNNITEAQEASKKTVPAGKSTLRAYDAKENDTIRPTITIREISAITATIK